ncbi:hypothetical protein [Actinophytocola xinjiangensis]|nr:hypothetical protein [Actinophytocola xinjiangensis]
MRVPWGCVGGLSLPASGTSSQYTAARLAPMAVASSPRPQPS